MTSTRGEGNRAAAVTPHAEGDAAFRAGLVDVLAEHDDPLLAAYLADDLELLNHNR
jgi:ribosomal protection tetracycline resistance protein